MKKYSFLRFLILLILLIFKSPAVYSKPISLNFNDIPARQALQFIAEVEHKNIVITDSVKNNITLHMNNLPSEEAFGVILQESGLGVKKVGNTLLILPLQELAQKEKLQQDMQNLENLRNFYVPLRYAKAADIATTVKNNNLLSPRGSISADTRTNTVWVQDIPSKLNTIQNFIKAIDISVKQVLIEARIVSVDENYERELGIKFQTNMPHARTQLQGHFNIDLPVANPNSTSIGLALAKLGDKNLLDLELSALETEGVGEIISSPRLMTANQQPAEILSGQEIPYQQATTSGATSISFQKAVLHLAVTPQITPGGKLILTLQLSQDRPTNTLIRGTPIIDTRHLQTMVTIKNGETVVLGGIYEQNEEKNTENVPFLSKIPLIGLLFQHISTQNRRRELLIFITPSIIDAAET